VPDVVPASATTVVGTQLERLAQIAAELGDRALAADARADRDRLVKARFFWPVSANSSVGSPHC
jgi:hypothetical protein